MLVTKLPLIFLLVSADRIISWTPLPPLLPFGIPFGIPSLPSLTLALPSTTTDLLDLSTLTVNTFGSQVSFSPGAFEGFRFAEPQPLAPPSHSGTITWTPSQQSTC